MKRFLATGLALGAVALCVYAATAQPPQGEIRTRQRQGGRPDDGPGAGPPRPPRWRLGTLIPPPMQEDLGLSEDQEQKLRDIEKDVRDKVMKMLTSEQRKKVQSLEKRGAGGRPGGGRGGPPDRGRSGDRPPRSGSRDRDDDRPPPPPGDRPPGDQSQDDGLPPRQR